MTRAALAVAAALACVLASAAGIEGQAPSPTAPPQPRVVRLDPALDRMLSVDAVVERVASGFGFVEGPVWMRDGSLLFSDLPANAIMRLLPGGQVAVFRQPSGYTGTETRAPGSHIGSNGLALDRQGRLLIAEHGDRRVSRLEADGSVTVVADRYDGKRLNSPNDIAVKSDGSIYFTDPPYGLPQQAKDPGRELPFSGVYRVADGVVQLLAQELSFPNGIGFSPDERYLYVANSDLARRIWMRYGVRPDGTLADGAVFYDASSETARGIPDGFTIDAAGNLFATGPGGLLVISPEGTLLGRIELPEPAANCAWGEDGKTLFITARTSVYKVRVLEGGRLP